MIEITKIGILLNKTDLDFENTGVLNPAAIRDGDYVHLFYRAVSTGNHSTIGYCRLKGPLTIDARDEKPLLVPDFEYESHGLEDPRIVKIDDLYYLTYTAYDGITALAALAVSKDLVHFDKRGLISPRVPYPEFNYLASISGTLNEKYLRYNERNRMLFTEGRKLYLWDKNMIFFPRRIQGKLCFLHRIKPDIQITFIYEVEELTDLFWQTYFLQFKKHIALSPKYDHEVSYIGGGCPPIETEHGWILIYHGVCDTIKGYVYSACAALLDLEDPRKEISRLPYPLFKPAYHWELRGEVNNVCFPTGTALFEDTLYIYYGAADERIACASLSLTGLLKELLLNRPNHDN